AAAGFELVNGQAVNVDPLAAMANPAALPQAIHMTLAAYAATGFAVAGIHALLLLKDPANAFHRRALAIALIVGAPAAVLQPISGDLSARHLARHQPVKLAAAEALFQTRDRKSTRLNSSHGSISYAVFCLKKKRNTTQT